MKQPIILAWSGGKDSSFALHQLQKENKYEVKYLLTTLNAEFKRISMHGVSEELLDAQAEGIGIPLIKVWIHEASYAEYEKQMAAALLKVKSEGILKVAFGDIFLEDLRKYREDNLAKVDMKAVFPLWKRDTKSMVKDFIEQGFKTITCCVNDVYLDESFVGEIISTEFIARLPENVDPCGENGEFHTFCFAGPIFRTPIVVRLEEKIYRPLSIQNQSDDCATEQITTTTGFWYQSLCL